MAWRMSELITWQIRGLAYFSLVSFGHETNQMFILKGDWLFFSNWTWQKRLHFILHNLLSTSLAQAGPQLLWVAWGGLCACAGKPITPWLFFTWASGQKGFKTYLVGQTEAKVLLKKNYEPLRTFSWWVIKQNPESWDWLQEEVSVWDSPWTGITRF